jgi:eukaryotic-like serine/threonine-protein kinase
MGPLYEAGPGIRAKQVRGFTWFTMVYFLLCSLVSLDFGLNWGIHFCWKCRHREERRGLSVLPEEICSEIPTLRVPIAMSATTSPARLVRFGAFEFDLHTLELRKHGLKIKLSGQPMEVLARLLASPGELVTREELQKRLWPHDTIVEFEHSINAAVKTLRRALDDSADEPRYIETLARRGYRFIAHVEFVHPAPVAAPEVEAASSKALAASEPAPPEAQLEEGVEEAPGDPVGNTVDHYKIEEELGAGGMGTVYRATDSRLGRQVAIKFLPEAFAKDPEWFEREARVLAALNHPNIAAIYGSEEAEGVHYLVLEYVPGETLAQRLKRGPLKAGEALSVCGQIAEALEAAHGKGVIHRDVKPANIKITPEGKVKVLDFGLAKAFRLEPSDVDLSEPPTTGEDASAGKILGTAAYMSPEQARGKAIDKRTDIWAFGCVLYEAVAGRRAFDGATASDSLAAVLGKEPDWTALPTKTPEPLRNLLRRCLQKDSQKRLRDIGDAGIAIEDSLAATADVGAGVLPTLGRPQGPPLQGVLRWALTVVFLVGAIVGAVSYWRVARAPARTVISEIGPPKKGRFNFLGFASSGLVISPDGHAVAFPASDATGKTMLWIRPLASPTARPLPGTEGAIDPFWSADSRSLGFFANNKLKTVEASGGPAVVVADAPREGGGAWNRDGTILFVSDYSKGIHRVSASGGALTLVIATDTSKFWSCALPRFLPDGKHFLHMAGSADPALAGVYFASLDGKERHQLLEGVIHAVYASGFLLYQRGNALMAQAFDPQRGQLRGDPQPIAERVATLLSNEVFDASENGILVYQLGGWETEKQLTWSDRAGRNLGVIGEVADYYDLRLSPDGAKLAANAGYPAGSPNAEIWVDDLARVVRQRLTIDPDTDHGIPVWSPDGNAILFGALSGKARTGIYRKPSSGASSEELLLPAENTATMIFPTSWSRDGRFILYTRGLSDLQDDIWILPLAGDRKPRLFVQAPRAVYDGQFSPNARWVAYTSKESGREEVYVVPFDASRVLNTGSGSAAANGGGKWQISASGGRCPRWRSDGKEIFYLSSDNQMMAAEIEERGNSIKLRPAQALFRAAVSSSFSPYDVTPDGKKFVINTLIEQDTPLTLVVNWTANLKK